MAFVQLLSPALVLALQNCMSGHAHCGSSDHRDQCDARSTMS